MEFSISCPLKRLGDGSFVLDSQIVSYTPSATAVQLSRSIEGQEAPLPLIAVGDVAYEDRAVPEVSNHRTTWIPLTIFRDLAELSQSRLHDLPESKEEVLAIAQIAGPQSRLLLGHDATETALKRESVISLEQAFLGAGAKSVVASLWNVEDQSTIPLMEAFYRHLADQEDKAAALRSAKRELLNANPSVPPYYWAGFVLVGEGATSVLLKQN